MSRPASVSAVVPCYNVGAFLEDAVESLLHQTEPPDEILVIDDHSTDETTLDTLERMAKKPLCRVIRQTENGGVARARNRGIDEARGEAVVFLDGDDMFGRLALARLRDALMAAPDAGFAYPTVRTFGNRNDVFLAPDFDHYVLHHGNICPIASMVRREALSSGVRFDPAITIGHEDWDFWLRLTVTGVTGTPARNATMLYRRMGFTRMDAGNSADEDFSVFIRRLRTEIYSPGRLIDVKRTWAPGLSVITDTPDAAPHERSTVTDVEFVPPDGSPPRGRYVLLTADGSTRILASRTAIERVLHFHECRPEVQILVIVHEHGADTPSIPFTELTADDLVEHAVRADDVLGLSMEIGTYAQIAAVDATATFDSALRHLRDLSYTAPAHVAWLRSIPHPAPTATTTTDPVPAAPLHVSAHEPSWTEQVRRGLATGTPSRLTPDTEGLFTSTFGTALVRTLVAQDATGSTIAVTDHDDPPPPGVIVGDDEFYIYREELLGTVCVMRVIDPHTGRRGLSLGEPDHPWLAERILGYAESTRLPATVPLHQITTTTNRGHDAYVYPAPHRPEMDGNRRPLIDAARLWRGTDPTTSLHVYDTSAARLARTCHVEGPVFTVFLGPSGDRAAVEVFTTHRPGDARISGVTVTPDDPPPGHITRERLGWIPRDEQTPLLRPVFLATDPKSTDILCSNLESEPPREWPAIVLGWSWC